MCEICSKLTVKTPGQRHVSWARPINAKWVIFTIRPVFLPWQLNLAHEKKIKF